MLKISHIKIVCINIILLLFLLVIGACRMPRGAFLARPLILTQAPNDSIFIALPTEFQVYNYFKVTYVKNNEVFEAVKQNDSTIVFMARPELKMEQKMEYRVEVGIVSFFEK